MLCLVFEKSGFDLKGLIDFIFSKSIPESVVEEISKYTIPLVRNSGTYSTFKKNVLEPNSHILRAIDKKEYEDLDAIDHEISREVLSSREVIERLGL